MWSRTHCSVCQQFVRPSIYTHVRFKSNVTVERQSRFLKKMMTGSSSSKKKFFHQPMTMSHMMKEFGVMTDRRVTPGGATSDKAMDKPRSGRPLRRVQVLNAIFMEQITSLLSTGEVSQEVLGLGINVTRVKVAIDFAFVNVYWVSSSDKTEQEISAILNEVRWKLRHEMSQLRVIGQVPVINFMKDQIVGQIQEVEALLAKCDFGEDFKPTPASKLFASSTPSLMSTTKAKTRDVVKDGDIVNESDKDTEEENTDAETPIERLDSRTGEYKYDDMRQNMLGFNHARVMSKIRDNVAKSLAARKSRECETTTGPRMEVELVTPGEIHQSRVLKKERSVLFIKYLAKQRSERARLLSLVSTESKQKEFLEQLREERLHQLIDSELADLDSTNKYSESDDELEYEADQDLDHFYEDSHNSYDSMSTNK